MVALAVLVLRKKDPGRRRPFRTPAVAIIAPLAIIGCVALYLFLPTLAKLVLIIWGAIGLLVYFGYSRRNSHVGRGIIEVVPDPNLQPELARPLDE
jgi:APA family basic amino acid/polyamine antiporter